MENDEKIEKTGTSGIVIPLAVEVLTAVVLFLKNTQAGIGYLYALIPLLLLTALLGTFLYNRDGDMKLFGCIAVLTAIGTGLQLYIDQVYDPINTFSFFKNMAGLFIACMFIVFYRMIRKLLKYNATCYVMMAVSALLYGILIVRGVDPNGYGTSAWISVGSITVQLTDFTKISALLFYASLFSPAVPKDDRRILIESSIFFGINLVGSLAIRELGSFLILLFLHLSILFIFMRKSRFKRIYLIAVFTAIFGAVAVSFLLYHFIAPSHDAGTMNAVESLLWPIVNKVHQRISVTANINSDPFGAGYQLYQGRKALYMAGLFGNSINFTAIPVAESDMAFVALVNSFGWIVGIGAILCFMGIVLSGLKLSMKLVRYELQDSIVIFGASILLFLQAMIVILGSCNIIPFTGLPIPFLSRGGTYQAIVFCFCGLLLLESEYNGMRMIEETPEEEEMEDNDDEDTQTIGI
ncbi:MAG: FtsW/RodA/SpoVE family cell cycle protein [Bulleidia sp.]